jgi:hypothetical protein
MPFVITRFRYNQFRCKEKKLHERRLETNRTLCLLRYNKKFVKNKFVINKFDCNPQFDRWVLMRHDMGVDAEPKLSYDSF